jgi:hypothetical protein
MSTKDIPENHEPAPVLDASKPQTADMLAQDDPVGPENDAHLRRLAAEAGVVVAAWGTHGTHGGRHSAVRAMLPACTTCG